MTGLRVHLRHLRDLGHCREGILAYCEAHGVARAELFGREAPGVELERVRAWGDRMALEIVAQVEAEEARRGQE